MPPAVDDPPECAVADVLDVDSTTYIERRLGVAHARQRIGIEAEHEARVFGEGIGWFHLENWYSARGIIRSALRLVGLRERARRNALTIRAVDNDIVLPDLPAPFEGFRILHLSDLHIDMTADVAPALIDAIGDLEFDLCVLTGDYRAATRGPVDAAIRGLERIRRHLNAPTYGVLGNHDSIQMLARLEEMGIHMLLNESIDVTRDDATLHIAGIDDAHYYRVDNIQRAHDSVRDHNPSILLSHTPEVYRQAAFAGFDVFLCGHTHGGQICLPGGYPVTLDARIPRHLGRGPWRFHRMTGYTSPGCGTSIVQARLNCPAEITVHRLLSRDDRHSRSSSPPATARTPPP